MGLARGRRRGPPPFIAEGWWTDHSVGQRMFDGLAAHRELPFVIHSQTRPWSGTFGDVLDLARRAASGLVGSGVCPGDVVTFQTPNWLEGAVTFYAAALVGAVVAPIVHIYGSRETSYILDACRPRCTSPLRGSGIRTSWPIWRRCRTSRGCSWSSLDGGGPAGSIGFGELLAARSALSAPVRSRPRQPSPRGVDLGHHGEPEGRGPLASDRVCRDRAARRDLAANRATRPSWPTRSAMPSACWARS